MALINLRNALMAGKRLYDTEVEFLESTGAQWIDTGIHGNSDTVAELSFAMTDNSRSDAGIFGSRKGYMQDCFTVLRVQSSNGAFWMHYGNEGINANYISTVIGNTTAWHTARLARSWSIDSSTGTAGQYTFTTPTTLKVFAADMSASGRWYAKMRLASLKIYSNNVLVRDYIPVRKGNVGYLYDRVSGALFGNAGTGDFVLGPDVVPVEWLESDGNQYIDTGVKPDATYTFDSTVAVMRSNYNCVYWGCRRSGTYTSDNSQCYLTNNTSSTAGEKFRQIRLLSTDANSNANWNSGIVPQTSVFYQLSGMSTVSTMNTMTYPIILFGLNNIGQKVTNVGCVRIAKWTVYKSGAKANNFLPVRVGTEGAMMDVLTRRIYRNAGTGAFTYGNDLKYPIPAS